MNVAERSHSFLQLSGIRMTNIEERLVSGSMAFVSVEIVD